jgi:hypothetical protein
VGTVCQSLFIHSCHGGMIDLMNDHEKGIIGASISFMFTMQANTGVPQVKDVVADRHGFCSMQQENAMHVIG